MIQSNTEIYRKDPLTGILWYDLIDKNKKRKIIFLLSNKIKTECLVSNEYQFKAHSKSEIFNSIYSNSTIKTERKENATTWLYEALQQYAGPNWEQGNQNKICQYMTSKFNENYGKQWQCIISSDTSKTIYGSVAIDTNEGDIYFMLSGGLDVYIFKSPGKFFVMISSLLWWCIPISSRLL